MSDTAALPRPEGELLGVPAAYWRGGTSKALIVQRRDLPGWDAATLDAWILAAFGSPDRRQIDGIGGADALTSKFAIVGPPTRPDADVDYAFFQVGVDRGAVHRDINCGNISAAIGPYAVDQGLIAAADGEVALRIHATNFGRIIHARFVVRDGRPLVAGGEAIDGVPGTGARIALDFRDTAGGRTGNLLPTGRVRDHLEAQGGGGKPLDMSVVDLANLVCFVRAEEFGLDGTEDPLRIEADATLMRRLETVRLNFAVRLGLRPSLDAARADLPGTPWLALIAPPRDWIDHATGQWRAAASADVNVRLVSRARVHKAFPGSGSACLGIAAMLPGSVFDAVLPPSARDCGRIRIGHPCGTLAVAARIDTSDGTIRVREASLLRTARKIMQGEIFVAHDRLPT